MPSIYIFFKLKERTKSINEKERKKTSRARLPDDVLVDANACSCKQRQLICDPVSWLWVAKRLKSDEETQRKSEGDSNLATFNSPNYLRFETSVEYYYFLLFFFFFNQFLLIFQCICGCIFWFGNVVIHECLQI